MIVDYLPIVFFFYGLSFFCMGLAILLEVGRGGDSRLRVALIPLAVFGIVHGFNEWLEMFDLLGMLPGINTYHNQWDAFILFILVLSFLSLAQFGAFLLVRGEKNQRKAYLIPFGMLVIWAIGAVIWWDIYPHDQFFQITNVWTRYSLAVPGALLATAGLVMLQREFRKTGMAGFGRDALWAAIALFWYGVIGQTFVRATALPPSDVLNQGLFLSIFGFPVQLLRAAAAIVVAIFVISFLRSFEVETQRHIEELQRARLEDAQRRESLRGDMLRRVVAAQEAERQRIARELHDETGQSLTALGMGLRSASTALEGSPERTAKTLFQLEDLVSQSLSELRRIIADLRPSHLDDLGLAAALRWYANEVETRTNLKVQVTTSGEQHPLSSEMTITLFRIAQEAISNVIRHSGAKKAYLRLVYTPEAVEIEIEDNGRGFNPASLDRSGRTAFGLIGMRERASLLGGKFYYESQVGKGTRVFVAIPYQAPVESEA